MPEPHEHSKIGPRIRAARRARRMTLEQLATATDLTKGFLSKLEHDTTTASVASLVRVCAALSISVGSLFDPSELALVRRGAAPHINLGGIKVADELYTPNNQEYLQVIRSHIEPGGGSGPDAYTLDCDVVFVYVLHGQLEVTVNGEPSLLHAGDGLTYTPAEPHTWRNPSSDAATVALWVLTPTP